MDWNENLQFEAADEVFVRSKEALNQAKQY